VLVDASGDPVLHLERAGVSLDGLDAIVLTHRHVDHIYALPSIFHNMVMRRRSAPLIIAGNANVMAFSHDLLGVFGLWERPGLPPIDWRTVAEGDSLTVGSLGFIFFEAPHSVPCLGFSVETPSGDLIYSADGGPNRRIGELAIAAPTLIHDATDAAAKEETLNRDGHSSARQAGAAARTIGARRLFLTGLRAMSPRESESLRQEAKVEFGGDVVVPHPDEAYEVDRDGG